MLNLSRGRTNLFCLALFSAVLTLPEIIYAENDRVLIAEIQIAGENAADDFIKLYNPSEQDIFLGNYNGGSLRLVKRSQNSTKDSSIKSWSKDKTAKIPAKGYFLWASSKNAAFPVSIKADSQTSQTISQNNGVALRIGPENTGEIIDSVGWGDFSNVLFEGDAFAQNPEAGQIISRKISNDIYQDTNNNQNDFYIKNSGEKIVSNATPLASNEPGTSPQIPTPQTTEKVPEKIPDSNNIVKQYPDGIVLSEILPAPEGPDETEEGIEIFNKNDFEVDLSGWRIRDLAGKSRTYVFPQHFVLQGKKYFWLTRPVSKITLNNDQDALELIKPDGSISDKVAFEKSPSGASYNLTETGWQWSFMSTPGSANIIQDQKTDDKKTAEAEKSGLLSEKSTAFAGKAIPGSQAPIFLIFAAVLTAAMAGAGILFLKKKIFKDV